MIGEVEKTTILQRIEAVEMLPGVTDEEREKARRVLETVGLSLERVERGGILYALRWVIRILCGESQEEKR